MLLSEILFRSHLDDDEEIYYVGHRHIWLYKKSLFLAMFCGLVVPIILFIFFPPLYKIWLGYLFIGFLYFLYKLADWYFDAWLITNKGILDVEWNGFFHRSSNRIEYHTINGVNYEICGFWGTVFRYGTISVDTFGAGTKIFSLPDAANPKNLELEILKNQEKFVREKSFRDHQTLKGLLSEMLQTRK